MQQPPTGRPDLGDGESGHLDSTRLDSSQLGPGVPSTPTADFVAVDAGEIVWRFDRAFLTSNWTCIWGRGCHGIAHEPASALQRGCCSLGAEIDGVDEARLIAASAAALTPELFQHHEQAAALGIFCGDFGVDGTTNTRLVEGACIFLNRPGFAGGAGCALHCAAVAADESPIDWKPSVCWQLPIHVDFVMAEGGDGEGIEIATVRPWSRSNWGSDGATMAWCCTERASDGGTDEAYVGDRRVVDSLGEELEALVGAPVYVELRRRLSE